MNTRLIPLLSTLGLSALLALAPAGLRAAVPPPNGPGGALSFNVGNEYLDVPDDLWFSGDFTVEGWVYVRTHNNWSRLLDFGNGEGNDNVLVALSDGTTGKPHFHVVSGTVIGPGITTPNPLPLNEWTHLACVLSGTTGTIYVNGSAVASGLLNRPRSVARMGCYLGRSNWAADAYANAIFDEVRIWNVARTAPQILEAMRRQLFGNESGLIAYYRLDEGSGPSAFDATGNPNHTATRVNGSVWLSSSIVPFASPVTTLAASAVAATSATLNGVVDGRTSLSPFEAYFEWGTTASLGNEQRGGILVTPGAAPQNFNLPLSDLVPGVTYYFRAVAVNAYGASYGTTLSFHQPTTLTVRNNNDSGAESLRQVLQDAGPGDTVVFAPNVTGAIVLASGELVISNRLSIQGPGANVLTLWPTNLSRVLRITAPNVAISGLRIENGRAPAASNGGGIRVEAPNAAITNCVFANNSAGTGLADGGGLAVMDPNSAVLHGCTFVGNQGYSGGAISVESPGGELLAINCTLVNNRALTFRGGGLRSGGLATLVACTVANNTAPQNGGVYRAGGTLTLSNCLVAGNSGGVEPEFNSSVTSGGHNLIGARPVGWTQLPTDQAGTPVSLLDPQLGPLQDNGGPTPTMALLPYSPAIDAGDELIGLPTDQRGFPRSSGCRVDIGAYELAMTQGVPFTIRNQRDSGPGSLRDAIACAPSGATITFAPNVTGVIVLLGGELVINQDLAILGPGPDVLAISGNHASRVFRINSGAVYLSGLTIREGRHYTGASEQPAAAGGILNFGSLVLTNCAVANNLAEGTPGLNGTFDNPPGVPGGEASAGGIFNANSLTLIRCLFSGNLARGASGGPGAIGIEGGAAGGAGGVARGGAIYNHRQLTALNCTFSGNHVVGGLGGDGAGATVADGLGGFGGPAEGGAIYTGPIGDCRLIQTTITGGGARGGAGGLHGDPALPTGPDGSGIGGGVMDFPSNTFLLNTLVANNTVASGPAPGFGPDVSGQINSQGHNLVGGTNGSRGWLTSDLVGSAATPLNPRLSALSDNGGPTLTHCLAPESPAIDAGDDGVLGPPLSLAFDQRGFPRRIAEHCDIGAFEAPERTGLAFVENTNDDGLGSLRQAIRCLARGGTIRFQPAVQGTVVLTTGELLIDKPLTIEGPGSGVLAINGGGQSRVFKITQGPVTLSGLTVANGVADSGGGVLALASVNFLNCVVRDCRAFSQNARGGGVAVGTDGLSGIEAKWLGCRIENCRAETSGGSAIGGGVYLATGTAVVVDTTITGCQAGESGGMQVSYQVSVSQALRMTNCTLSGNLARRWGALRLVGGGIIAKSLFTSNRAGAQGGARCDGGPNQVIFIINSSFIGNEDGIGELSQVSALVSYYTWVINCTFSGNRGETTIRSYNFPQEPPTTWIVNSTIVSNTLVSGISASQGRGNEIAAVHGWDWTFGSPGGDAGHISLLNVIAASSTFEGQPGQDVSGVTSLGHNLIGLPDPGFRPEPGDFRGTANTPWDPRLGPLGYYGGATPVHRPLAGSSAINNGDDDVLRFPYLLTTDQRGGVRRAGPHVDIGSVDIGGVVRMISVDLLPLGPRVRFTTEQGWPHQLERKDNLAPGPWSSVGPPVSGTGGTVQLQDPIEPGALVPRRFYRVRVGP